MTSFTKYINISKLILVILLIADFSSNAQVVVGNLTTHTEARAWNNATADFSHNHNTGSDGVLIVVTAVRYDKTVSWAKYNGISMNLVSNNYNDGKVRVAIFELANPPSGSHTVETNLSSNGATFIFYAQSFTGATTGGDLNRFARCCKTHSRTLSNLTVGSRLLVVGATHTGSASPYTVEGTDFTPVHKSGSSAKTGFIVSNAITSSTVTVITRGSNNNGNNKVAHTSYEILAASSCSDPTVSGYTAGSRCGTGAVSIVGTASAGSINWFAAANGGTSIGSSASGAAFSTPSISSTTTYYAEAVDGSCTSSSRQAVVATVNALPTVAGNTPGSRCGTGTVALAATASAGSINWYSAANGGGALSNGNNYTTGSISSTTTYYAEAVSGSCSSSPRQAVAATVNTRPTILSSSKGARVGTGTVIMSAAASAGPVKWYAAADGGSTLTTNNSFTSGSISSTTIYYAQADNGTCTSSPRTEVKALVYAKAPGGVASNLLLWLKADAQANSSGTTLATDGQRVDNWKDQTYNDLDADDSDGTGPVWDADGINGNPALDFTGSGSGNPLDIPNGIMQNETKTNMYVYAVCATDLNQWNTLFWQDLNTSNTNEIFSFIPRFINAGVYWDNGNNSNSRLATTYGTDLGTPYLYSAKSTSGAMEVKRNGVSMVTGTNTGSSTADNITPFYIGYRWDNQNTYFDGKLAELIILDGIPTAAQEDQIESYLSIKYGIGVGTTTDVKNSAGTVVWDKTTNSSYNNDIIGIGRDDNSGLDQKSSQAINSSDVLKISTLSNAQTGANNTFEIWGNNNGSVAVQADNSGTSHNGKVFNQTIARKWLIQETGTVGAVKIEIDLTNSSFSSPAAQKMALVFDNDGGFNGSADESYVVANTYNSGTKMLTFNSVNLTDGKYVSLMKSASVLPVELLGFNVEAEGCFAHITWSTASEINNDYFSIEYSYDGADWIEIDKVYGAGNSNEVIHYSHYDFDCFHNQLVYYRIVQVDFDGTRSSSDVKPLNVVQPYTVKIFPNPTKGNTTVEINAEFGDRTGNVVVRTMSGQKVFSKSIVNGKNQLNLMQLAPDTYIMKVSAPDQLPYYEKLVILK